MGITALVQMLLWMRREVEILRYFVILESFVSLYVLPY